jgi:hypothetical protein
MNEIFPRLQDYALTLARAPIVAREVGTLTAPPSMPPAESGFRMNLQVSLLS